MSESEMSRHNPEVGLHPYKIESVEDKSSERIPKGVKMIHAPYQWDKGNEGKNVLVATIDTGVDYNHPDLKDIIVGGKDFTGKGDYMDGNGHGSHVAGIIGAVNNGLGLVGVAPKVQILALKALNDEGRGNMDWTCQALRYAIESNVDVINMSLGGPSMPRLHTLVKEAKEKGIIVVAAAGNSGDGNIETPERSYPGFYDEVFEVGAVDFRGELAHFSNTNRQVDILAPGVNILSTYKDGKYAKLSGTSMATPHVVGAVALLKSHNYKDYHKDDRILDVKTDVYGDGKENPNPIPIPDIPSNSKPKPELPPRLRFWYWLMRLLGFYR